MRLRVLALTAPVALVLAGCGGSASGSDEPSTSKTDVSAADKAACDSAYENGGPAAVGDDKAVQALRDDLGDVGPDDDLSDDVSPYLQLVSADALLLSTGGAAPNMADHVDDAFAACQKLGWEAPE